VGTTTTIFWEIMSPNGGGQPSGEIAGAISEALGDTLGLELVEVRRIRTEREGRGVR
jgi:superoxide dismutase